MIAEVIYPPRAENGVAVIGAWISSLKEIRCDQAGKLCDKLPDAQITPDRNGLKIEVQFAGATSSTITRQATILAAAIYKTIGVRPGLCPVTCNKDIHRVTRAG